MDMVTFVHLNVLFPTCPQIPLILYLEELGQNNVFRVYFCAVTSDTIRHTTTRSALPCKDVSVASVSAKTFCGYNVTMTVKQYVV